MAFIAFISVAFLSCPSATLLLTLTVSVITSSPIRNSSKATMTISANIFEVEQQRCYTRLHNSSLPESMALISQSTFLRPSVGMLEIMFVKVRYSISFSPSIFLTAGANSKICRSLARLLDIIVLFLPPCPPCHVPRRSINLNVICSSFRGNWKIPAPLFLGTIL